MVLSIISDPLCLGNTDLHWLRCGRAQNVEGLAVLARGWKIFRRTSTEKRHNTSPLCPVYYCSDVKSDCLFGCCPVRYLQTSRNFCQDLQLEQACNHVSANVLPACDCGFNLWSCHSKTESGKGLVDSAPSSQLVTFVEETPMMKHRVVTHTIQDKK